MADELDDGVNYLRALKQAGAGGAAAAAPRMARAPDSASAAAISPAQSSPAYEGAEKRRSPRYKCEGSAELREEGCDVRTWATFTDISLHGCYVEAQATYPAGNTLHMKLEANGVRVETNGTVRVNYPYLGMGIAFTDMSEENSHRLRQLLATITHPCMIVGPGIASSLPSTGPLAALPAITDPTAALQELILFFESRQMLMRDDFLRLVKKTQTPEKK